MRLKRTDRRLPAGASLCIGLALALALPAAPSTAAPAPTTDVIVIARSVSLARDAVEATGGSVSHELDVISGVSATVAIEDIPTLSVSPGVLQVSPDEKVSFQGASAKKCSEYKRKKRRKRCRRRKRLAGLRIQRVVRADKLWAEGIDGHGVTVAILDTGVYAEHSDLGDRVIHCEDFSNEFDGPAPLPTPSPSLSVSPLPSPSLTVSPLPDVTVSPLPSPDVTVSPLPPLPLRRTTAPISEEGCSDPFGHGTFMAGLTAGDGTGSNGRFSGAAPGADLVGIKVAGFDGSTDISKILAGIQWAVAHKDVYGIRVLNLSLGTDSAQDYRVSPLNLAVERAWQAGIVVVVSAGNSGPAPQTVMKPGDDPYVITVGSSNDEGTIKVADDRIPVFSSRGSTRSNGLSKPDLVSPGVHTTSLRSPGSAIDQGFSEARVGDVYFRGTGTSMSTATVSGIVALILQRDPTLTPDQVKHRLTTTARTIADTDLQAAGAGLVDAYGAVHSTSEGEPQLHETSTGLGSLELDRGSLGHDEEVEVVTPAGQVTLRGEFVAMLPSQTDPLNPDALVPWLSVDYATSGWDPDSWNASTWKSEEWAASTWKASTWKATEWDASTWKGTEWTEPDWDASTWKNVDWDASTWKASTWKSAWYAAAWD